jgi:hypothetical protein
VPIIIGCLIFKNRNSLTSEDWKRKYSTLTDDVRTDSLLSSMYVFVLLSKWLLTIVSLTVFINLPALQLGATFFLSLLYQIYLITVWPRVSCVSNWLDLFNELMVTAYLYGSLALTDTRVLQVEWYLISVIGVTAAVNSASMCWSMQRAVRGLIRERWGKADKHPEVVVVEGGKVTRARRIEVRIEEGPSSVINEEVKEEEVKEGEEEEVKEETKFELPSIKWLRPRKGKKIKKG